MKNLCLLLLCYSCGSSPTNVLNTIQRNGLAGHYSHYKNTFGDTSRTHVVDSYFYIGCDGSIKYKIDEPWALIFKVDNDDGKIKSLIGSEIVYTNWLGITKKEFYKGPIVEKNGCHTIHFKGTNFSTFYPINCNESEKSLFEHFDEAVEHLKKNDYVFCE